MESLLVPRRWSIGLFALGVLNAAQAADAPAASAGLPACAAYDRALTRAEPATRAVPVCARITPELGGLRKSLADYGVGITVTSYNGYTYDLGGHNAGTQVYNGQNPSYNASLNLYTTYDLTRLGFANDAQLTLAGQVVRSTYEPANPEVSQVSVLAVNQSFFDHRLEIEYGYVAGVKLFYGVALGGNASTAALGPNSVVPFQVGMSATVPTPTFNVITRDASLRWYNSAAITRSVSPQGILEDVNRNPNGLHWKVAGANPMLIDEVGYKRAASATENAVWSRFGMMYNTSHYTEFKTGEESDNNWGLYFADTHQVSKPYGDARGWYLDTKLDFSPDSVNAINKAFQVSAFNMGPFASRPFDMVSMGFSKSYYSKDLREVYDAYRMDSVPYTMAVTGSYAARLSPGIYLVNGLTWTKNPVFSPDHPDALLLQTSLNLLF